MNLSWGVLIVDVVSSTASPLDFLLRESSAAPNVFFCAPSLALCGPCGNSVLSTLLINVYLPTDYGTSDSNNAFLESLQELDGFISMQSFDNIIICGDFNVHFSQSNHNCVQLLTFVRTYNLVCADLSCNIKYTY